MKIKVKPLDWRPYRNGDADAVVPAFGIVYSAYATGYWRSNKDPKFKKGGKDLADAKAAVQAHFDSIILSLVSTPNVSRDIGHE